MAPQDDNAPLESRSATPDDLILLSRLVSFPVNQHTKNEKRETRNEPHDPI